MIYKSRQLFLSVALLIGIAAASFLVSEGNQVGVMLSIETETPARSVYITLEFDETLGPVQLTSQMPETWTSAWHSPAPGEVRFIAFTWDPVNDVHVFDGVIFTLTFPEAQQALPKEVPIKVRLQEILDADNQEIAGVVAIR